MRRSRRPVGGRVHYEVAAVISVLGLAVMGRPILAGGQPAAPVTLSASALQASAELASALGIVPIGSGPLAWFAPAGRNEGAENLAMTLARLALQDNEPLYLSSSWGRRSGPAKSDHHVGNTDAWAVDLAVAGIQRPTPQTEEAARRVAAALGRPDWKGGDLKVTIQGYRFQVLWRVSGHFNHVHVGVKKV